jgi:hypothetical protein
MAQCVMQQSDAMFRDIPGIDDPMVGLCPDARIDYHVVLVL